ncbi:hypothetical protein [Streptomyces hainanensis]|uniref:STAS domain-containing protein n=1 Tax=Streptomyces hainanensis TaxID=402648 RepID=A0A4R4T9B9_9ACTN|nr:hypothetical protein [Streptomyces hainanensis]TDC73677.1 hypothetical protein E1283_18515 [Streptomyces hainanensis]
MSWNHDHRDGIDVLTVTGFLRHDVTHRFADGVDWVTAHSAGPVVLDLTHLRGCDKPGERAVLNAIDRLLTRSAPFAIWGLGETTVDRVIPERLRHVRIASDLATALRDLTSAL